MKRKAALFMAVTIIVSCCLVAGCTSLSSSSSSSQGTSGAGQESASTTHDKILQAVIDDDQQAYVNASWTRTVNKTIQWVNDTTVLVTYKIGYANTSALQYTAKYLKFSSDAAASEYVSSINEGYNSTSAMSLMNDIGLTTASSVNNHQNYERATSRIPTTNAYEKVNNQGSAYQGSYILQVNEVVITYNLSIPKNLSSPGAI